MQKYTPMYSNSLLTFWCQTHFNQSWNHRFWNNCLKSLIPRILLKKHICAQQTFARFQNLIQISNNNNRGWPNSKVANSIVYYSENMQFWPHVVKAKLCLENGSCISILKIVNKQLTKCKNCILLKHIFASSYEDHKCLF